MCLPSSSKAEQAQDGNLAASHQRSWRRPARYRSSGLLAQPGSRKGGREPRHSVSEKLVPTRLPGSRSPNLHRRKLRGQHGSLRKENRVLRCPNSGQPAGRPPPATSPEPLQPAGAAIPRRGAPDTAGAAEHPGHQRPPLSLRSRSLAVPLQTLVRQLTRARITCQGRPGRHVTGCDPGAETTPAIAVCARTNAATGRPRAVARS